MIRPLTLLLVLVPLAGCAGLSATDRAALTAAGTDLDQQLEPPGRIAATALLYRETTGRYPATPFELLGSAAARETGLQRLGLSALTVEPDGDALRIAYTLLPTRADPSSRYGTLRIAPGEEAGTYDVGLVLEREADPDLSNEDLPLTRRGTYAVTRATGTLCAEVEAVRARLAAGADVGTPPLNDRATYTVTFRPTASMVAPEALREGFSVTLPQ